MNEVIYYIADEDSQFGPFNESDLKNWLVNHSFKKNIYIWDSVTNEWNQPDNYKELLKNNKQISSQLKSFSPNIGTKIYLEDESKYKEKRRFVRLPVSVKVKYLDKESHLAGWEMKDAISQEISTAGISFLTEEKIKVDSIIVVNIITELNEDKGIILEGVVRRSDTTLFKGMFETGVEFLEIDTETKSKLKNFLKNLLF
ncbi:MAG: PilZ domain-containing protein [Candidatus Hydrogenedentota bacterium]